jgi:hypothetical protein
VAAAVASVVAAVLCAPPAAAQGNLAVQGLGYAPGQLSSATRGIGGAAAEFDPLTPINPATLALWGRPAVYLQFEPEARKTTTPTSTDATGASRFPLLATGLALGSRVAIGASFSTFLDRTSAVTRQGFQTIGGDTVGFTETARVRGAIADSRLGVAVSLPFQVALGVGLHAYTGEHRLNDRRGYDPDSPYVGYAFDRVVRYSGRAVSAGMTWQPIRWFGLGASLRTGGRLDAVNEAAALNVRADAPSRWSVAVKTEPARGTLLYARTERTRWSSLAPMLESAVGAFDTEEIAAGVDAQGPRIGGVGTLVRFGVQQRGLPFGVAGRQIDERSVMGGVAVGLAQGRALLDLTLQRASRSASGGLAERAWITSIGLSVRP